MFTNEFYELIFIYVMLMTKWMFDDINLYVISRRNKGDMLKNKQKFIRGSHLLVSIYFIIIIKYYYYSIMNCPH
jgi:hypothetical protein